MTTKRPFVPVVSNRVVDDLGRATKQLTDWMQSVFSWFAPGNANVYQESGETTRTAQEIHSYVDPGAHSGFEHAAVHIELRPVGSGTNGPTSADTGLQISNVKQGYPTTTVDGETDGINVVIRNSKGDAAALVTNTQIADGFGCLAEGITSQVPVGGGAVTKLVDVQIGTIDTPSGQSFGVVTDMNVGAGTDAVRMQTSGTGTLTNFLHGVLLGVSRFIVASSSAITQLTNNQSSWTHGVATELLTLNTGGLTTDSAANLLPANSIIEAVACRITTTITATTNWAVGDPTTSNRFSSPNATLTAGTTSVGLNHWSGAIATLAAGPSQAAADKVRITCTGANPGAGVIRLTVWYRTIVAPTS